MTKRKDPSDNTDETPNQKQPRKPRARRIKGTGSVYPRADGRWGADFIVEATGKKKTLYGKTAKEAQAKLDQALLEQKQGILATGKDQKLKDYLENWFENVHKPTLRMTSYASQRVYVYKHIIPALGHVQLRKLTAQQVQKFVTDKGKEGLSAKYIKSIHDVLHGALDNAVKWKLVSENVCDQVTRPPIQKRKKHLLTKEQIIKLIEVANSHKMGPFVKLGLMSGLRHGEMLALRWSDIDFETNILSVIHTVTRPGLGLGAVEGDPKTEDGIRKIILPQFVANALKVHRELQQAQKGKVGDLWKNKDLVFCTCTGGYIDPSYNLMRFHRVLKEAGLPETMRIHDLRHNVATFLANVLKYPPHFVQALLGHSNIAITLGMYVEKVDPETLRPMMKELNDLFGGSVSTIPHDLRHDVIMFLINALNFPPDVARPLLENDPDALRQLMNELNNLFGGGEVQ